MLITATQGTWLVGHASEHHILYAYQLDNAQNVFISMQQVESPYYQPVPEAPAPWTPNATWHDPTFAGCNLANGTAGDPKCYMQWAQRILGAQTNTINVYGSAFWVFFNNYSGNCGASDGGQCQLSATSLEGLSSGDHVTLYNQNVHSTDNLVIVGGSGGQTGATFNQDPGSWGAVLAAYLAFE